MSINKYFKIPDEPIIHISQKTLWFICIFFVGICLTAMVSAQLPVFTDKEWQYFIRYRVGLVFLVVGIFFSYKLFNSIDKSAMKKFHDYIIVYSFLIGVIPITCGFFVFILEVSHKPITYFFADAQWKETLIVKYKYSYQRFCGRGPSISFDKFDVLCVSEDVYKNIDIGDRVTVYGRRGYKGFLVDKYYYVH